MFTDYTMIVRPDDNGTFVAYLPAIEGCHAWGQTAEEARLELFQVFTMIQEEYLEEEKPLPKNVELRISHAC